jgi:PPOX class probable FMN-dependent enzyme
MDAMKPDAGLQGVTDLQTLERLYEKPLEASLVKEIDYIHPDYRAFIAASPFVVLATSGPEGLDASPRGDRPGFVSVADDRTLLLPDRRGNNRIDSLRNIVSDPRVGLLFLIPGVSETIRVNGRAVISTAPALLERFAVDGKPPRTVLVVHVDRVYFQCARAILRSALWDPAQHADRAGLPSIGKILDDLTRSGIDAATYDQSFAERVKTTLY